MSKTQLIVLVSAVLLFAAVLNLVRRRRFREEYSWLWLAAATFYLIMALKPNLINRISSYLGITNAITAFVFFGLLFIVMILIHYSVKLSRLATQMKDVAQQVAILDGEQNKISHLLESSQDELFTEKACPVNEQLVEPHQNVDILES